MLCLDYFNLQERRNMSNFYIIARGHWFPVYGHENECSLRYFFPQEIGIPTKIYLGWNKVTGCHTKLTTATFFLNVTYCLSNYHMPMWIKKADISITKIEQIRSLHFVFNLICLFVLYIPLNWLLTSTHFLVLKFGIVFYLM